MIHLSDREGESYLPPSETHAKLRKYYGYNPVPFQVKVGPGIDWWLDRLNVDGLAFNKTIYLHSKEVVVSNTVLATRLSLLVHELVHLDQQARMGLLKFFASYLYEWMVSGYKKNKYEVEANMLEDAAMERAKGDKTVWLTKS